MKNYLLFLLFLCAATTAFAQPVNDDCATSQLITVQTGGALIYTAEISTATESIDASCDNAANTNFDVWFNFNMPVDGNVRLNGISGSEGISLFDGCGGAELDCFYGNGFLYNLNSGQNYTLRVSRTAPADRTFNIEAFETATNDECADRTLIAVQTGGALSYSYDTRQASESTDSSCDTATNTHQDVWYEFTMPVDGNIRITSVGGSDSVALYDSCAGTEVACFYGSGFVYDLTATTTYVLRMARRSLFSGAVTFDIEAFATAVNDECVDRTTIAVQTGGALSYSYDTRQATESIDSSCDTAVNTYQDVWYEFTMPVNGNVRVNNIGGSDSATIYDACAGTEVACFYGNGFFYNLTATTTYVLRMSKRSLFAGAVTFNIEAFETAANDECVDRTTIAVQTGGALSYAYDTRQATESTDSSCDSAVNTYQDVWYEFTMPVNGNVRVNNIGGSDSATIYDACAGTEVACFYGNGFFYDLTATNTYVLRMSKRAIFSSAVTFDIEAFETAANDECVDRTTITVQTGGALSYSYDTREATESTDSSCDNAANTYQDVWYEFTMPVDGNVRITDVSGSDSATLYDACAGVELACFYGNGFFYDLTETTTYVLRMSKRAIFSGAVTFDIEAFEGVSNNDCASATSIGIGVVSPTAYSFDNRGATEEFEASCDNAGNTNMDLWLSFIMPVTGNIEITGTTGSNGFSFFDSCGGAELDCYYGNGTIFGLTAGTEYFLRLNKRAIFAGDINFNIQALEAPLSPCSATTEWIAGAWNNGAPDLVTNAIIRSAYDTATDGSISCCSLSIDTSTLLVVRDGDFVEVAFNVDVNGTLDINHQGSLVQKDATATATNNGTIRVRKTTPFLKPRDFMIMGSPMTMETREGVYNNAFLVLKHNTLNFVPNSDVAAAFPLAENFADDNGNNWSTYMGAISAGEGYLVRPQSSYSDGNTTYDLIYEQGTLNNGDVSFPILFNTTKNDSPNVLGNPYASAIFAGDFINSNTMIDEVYFWEHLTPPSTSLPGYGSMNFSMEDISMYNLTGGIAAASDPTGTATIPNGSISSGQGFGVKASASGTAVFTNAMRRLSNNDTWRRPEAAANRIWLQVTNSEYELQNTTLIGFLGQATEQLDPGFDSKRLATVVSLYSETSSGDELGIQARETFDAAIKVPIGFSTLIKTQTEYVISVKNVEGLELNNSTVYLFDNLLNTLTELSQEDYSFTSGAGQFKGRFTLLFEDQELGMTDQSLDHLMLYPNPAKNILFVGSVGANLITEISVFDLTGRRMNVSYLDHDTSSKVLDVSGLSSGRYLLVIKGAKGQVVKQFLKE